VVLLLLIIFDKNITAKEAAKIIGVSERSIKDCFTKLKEAGVIERKKSPAFGGYWIIRIT
jgi:predicted ArsR family transcriptional regulator